MKYEITVRVLEKGPIGDWETKYTQEIEDLDLKELITFINKK